MTLSSSTVRAKMEAMRQGDWQPAKPTFKTHNCIERERERKREWEREGLG